MSETFEFDRSISAKTNGSILPFQRLHYLRNRTAVEKPGEKKQSNCQKKIPEKNIAHQVAVYILELDNKKLRKIRIKDISRNFHINASFLSRKFKEDKECTLCEFIQKVKIQRAVFLLQQLRQCKNRQGTEIFKPLTVNVISDTLGFSSTEYFIRCFKKRMGVSPNQYRKYFQPNGMGMVVNTAAWS